MGARSRRKGAAHELALAQIARDHGFPRARRSAPLQAGERATDTGRKKEPDIDGIPLLWVEGKHEKKASPRAYAREYLRERPGFIPVVCWRAQGMGPDETVAELKFTDLLKLLRAATKGWEPSNALREWDCGPCKYQENGECTLGLDVPDSGCSDFCEAPHPLDTPASSLGGEEQNG